MKNTVAIVGAGRVGRALGRELHHLGWEIGAVVTQSKASARTAVRAIGAGRGFDRLTHHILNSEIILITVNDAAIGSVAAELAKFGGEEWRGKIVLHASGALDRRVLSPLANCGAATGSIHPLQTFSGRGAPPLEGILFAIAGDPRARRVAARIARALGGLPITLRSGSKPAYHAAATFASGYVLALMESAMRILIRLGFTRRRARAAFLPLARQTLANFEQAGAHRAWTGALARGDMEIIAEHAIALAEFPREFLAAYAAMARLSVRVFAEDPELLLRGLNRSLKAAAEDAISR